MKRKKLLLELDARDEAILAVLTSALEAPRVQVVRWALRYYLLVNPEIPDQLDLVYRAGLSGATLQLGPYQRRKVS